MKYTYASHKLPDDKDATRRRTINVMADTCLVACLPSRVLGIPARLAGRRSSAQLARKLVMLVRRPDVDFKLQVFTWALSYGGPNILRRLHRSLSGTEPSHWGLRLMKQAKPDLFLPREYLSPDYQILKTTNGAPRRALVCFTGISLRLNIPVQLFHCAVVGSFDILIYLRDKRRTFYADGVSGLGENPHRVTTALAEHLPEDCRVSVLATSGGGIAAALAAKGLRASRLALFSPSLPSKAPGGIRATGVDHIANTRLFFAGKHPADQDRAREWRNLKNMPDIEWLDTSSHGTLQHVAATEQLGSFIEWLAGGPAKRLN